MMGGGRSLPEPGMGGPRRTVPRAPLQPAQFEIV